MSKFFSVLNMTLVKFLIVQDLIQMFRIVLYFLELPCWNVYHLQYKDWKKCGQNKNKYLLHIKRTLIFNLFIYILGKIILIANFPKQIKTKKTPLPFYPHPCLVGRVWANRNIFNSGLINEDFPVVFGCFSKEFAFKDPKWMNNSIFAKFACFCIKIGSSFC